MNSLPYGQGYKAYILKNDIVLYKQHDRSATYNK